MLDHVKVVNKKLPVLLIILPILLFITCDGGGSNMARYYIEEPSYITFDESLPAKIPQIFYFFDRTTSMQGFASTQNSEYSNIIPQLWMVAESSSLWPESEASASFLTFSEGDIRSVTRGYVRDNIRLNGFYGNSYGTRVFSTGSRQVFAAAAGYISERFSEDNLFVLITDLYEQNREDNCFSVLFRNAFENGMSGAVIAVQSRYNGFIENISNEIGINIRVDGASTFFIFIIGKRDTLVKYCEGLFATPDFQRLKSEKVLFLLGDESKFTELPWTPVIRNANSEKVFERFLNGYNINLRDDIPKLLTAQGNAVDPLKAESFRLIGNFKSQYIGGLPVQNIDSGSFEIASSFTVRYNGGDKIPSGELSVFELINDNEKVNFSVNVIDGSEADGMDFTRYPFAVIINTKNDSLKKGCYHVNYEIFQRAKIPQWVTEMNADTITELDQSKSGPVIKILRLESIYRYIAQAYNNRSEWGRIYANSVYFEKTR